MKKFTVVAMVVALMTAGSAFAVQRHLTIAPNATFAAGSPASTNNDDTCDIGVAPAATLLLPYFEVDFVSAASAARTTLFTITNTSRLPQVAHVVLWTDWSYAALDFNIFLTGYDVQAINMYDIFNRGIIAPGAIPGVSGSTSGTDVRTTAPSLTVGNPPNATPATPNATANPNFIITGASAVGTLCQAQPGVIPGAYLADLQRIFTTGQAGAIIGAGCTTRLGGIHSNAVGYVTVDVAATCTTSLPGPGYFSTFINFDNVLIGDYQDINPNATTGNYAGGNPMVHLRAVPEGGPPGALGGTPVATNLPFTFYDRYTTGFLRTIDRRQPLPSVFAARYIQGGTGNFNTNYKIWREGLGDPSGSSTNCNVSINSALAVAEIVRFDEHENATTAAFSPTPISPPIAPTALTLPETSSTSTANSAVFPTIAASGDVAGWMYLNLNDGGGANLTAQRAGFGTGPPVTGAAFSARNVSQNWTIISMFAEGRYSVDFDAAWLGNGCSGAVAVGATVGPVGGVPVCPVGATGCTPGVAPYTGTNVTP